MAPPDKAQLAQKEARITLALEAFKKGCFSSKRACANVYDISEAILRQRVKGIRAPCDTVPRSRKLTTTEESTLIEKILSMDQHGLAPTYDTVRQMANLLLQKRSSQNQENQATLPTIGQHWAYNFVQRYKALKSKYNYKYNYQRAKCKNPTLIRSWFQLVHNTIKKYSILDTDIYNFNETGFQMGVISTAKVITRAERSNRPVTVQPGNREWVTAIDCIYADGQSLLPVIIFEGKMH
jgi:hypothetical protein